MDQNLMTFDKIKFLFEHKNLISIFNPKLTFAQPSLDSKHSTFRLSWSASCDQTIKFWNEEKKVKWGETCILLFRIFVWGEVDSGEVSQMSCWLMWLKWSDGKMLGCKRKRSSGEMKLMIKHIGDICLRVGWFWGSESNVLLVDVVEAQKKGHLELI